MNYKNITLPTECRVVVATADITGFAKAFQSKSNQEIFDLLAEFYELVGRMVEEAGGKVVKFMGDAPLMIFPEDRAKQAVAALRSLTEKSSGWLSRFGSACQLRVKAHTGSVVCGPLGTATEKPFDIVGNSLVDLFRMPSGDFVISPELQKLLNDGSSPGTTADKHPR